MMCPFTRGVHCSIQQTHHIVVHCSVVIIFQPTPYLDKYDPDRDPDRVVFTRGKNIDQDRDPDNFAPCKRGIRLEHFEQGNAKHIFQQKLSYAGESVRLQTTINFTIWSHIAQTRP